jgi:hypothetical protein
MNELWDGVYVQIGGNEKYLQTFGLDTSKGRDHLEDLGIGGKIILRWILEKECVKVGEAGFD